LLDRCLIVWLPAIPEDGRRPEAELFAAFEKVRPQIFGALLDAVSGALRCLPAVKLARLPRMADFAIWATAAEEALGWPAGAFLDAYQGNRDSANEVALEASTIAKPLLELLDEQGEWSGSAAELLTALDGRMGDQAKRQHGWPKNPRSMSGHLKRLSPNLRAAGWTLEQDRSGKKRSWSIVRSSSVPSPQQHLGESTQAGATRCNSPSHDANDGNDANAGEGLNDLKQHGDAWEEGEF
jgi:hypothetical protein